MVKRIPIQIVTAYKKIFIAQNYYDYRAFVLTLLMGVISFIIDTYYYLFIHYLFAIMLFIFTIKIVEIIVF